MPAEKNRVATDPAWLAEPELPRAEEIMAREPQALPHNEVEAPPESKARYLESQYRLLRYEGTELLRRAVQEFREDPDMEESRSTAIYTNVVVHGYLVTRLGTLCRIGFCPTRVDKRIRWKNSARLTPGTVVALSTAEDKFRSICMIASVVQKDLYGGLQPNLDAGEHEDTPPRIDIAWANPQDAILDPQVELVMIEPRNGYYESVRHALQGLQKWSSYPSRFERYFINGTQESLAPQYIKDANHAVDFTPIVTNKTAAGTGADTLRSVNVRNSLPSSMVESTGLDSSQMNALRHILTSELAIVQGPPGTGKTFTSISALKILLSNLDSQAHPIIIAAQTNHALDQILLLLAKATKAEFVRLGRRSQNEFIASCTTYNLRKKSQKAGGAELGRVEARRRTHITAMKDLIGECFPEGLIKPEEFLAHGLISQAQFNSLGTDEDENPFYFWLENIVERCYPHRFRPVATKWEEVEDPDAHNDQGISVDDDEKDRLSGQYIPIQEQRQSHVDSEILRPALWTRVQAYLRKYDHLYDVPREFRGAAYRYLRNKYIEAKTRDLRLLLEESVRLTKDGRACRATMDARAIREFNIPVIGCTTTGLTKYRKLIETLEPRVMLIEEAAETREANITSALFPSLEHLILVGDHMQLAPHTDLAELSCHPYNLCLSLFERMVNLNVGHAVLSVQRRMVPEIRRILKPFYPSLEDHESVLNKIMRPPVPGMGDVSSYFFCHRWPETRTRQESRSNPDEARMIVGFVRYLVQNGTPASKITILTFYRGQRGLIHDFLAHDPVLNNLNPLMKYNVCTVDGYQGEENDVVILSLVRCPDNNNSYNVGFLDNRNRVVVALSRARRGFYIFGSYMNLVRSGEKAKKVWKPSLDILAAADRCHSRLPIVCKKHGNTLKVKNPQDWVTLHGGCREKCAATLECGHVCQLLCHPFSHNKVSCKRPCIRKLACGHGCSEVCSDRCRCGKKCNFIPKARKKTNTNFVTLDNFLGSDEDEDEEKTEQARKPPAPASAVVEDDAAQDLISVWGNEDTAPSSNDAVGQSESSSASPESANSHDLSGEASGKDLLVSGAGSVATTRDSALANASPVTPACSTGCASEKSLPASSESEGTNSIRRQAVVSRGSRNSGQVINETFREVRVRDGFRREDVAKHRFKSVHATYTDKTVNGPGKMDSPEVPKIPVKAPRSPPSDGNLLIDLWDVPVEIPAGVKSEALGSFTREIGPPPEKDLPEFGNLRAGVGATGPEEDGRSEVSDLIAF